VARHETNERLEFLGDAVLELYISEVLLHMYPLVDEGVLTRLRSHIVRTESLAEVSRRLGLGQHLVTSHSESSGEAANSEAVLADTFEAVTGAIYQQHGYAVASAFIQRELVDHRDNLNVVLTVKDPKSQLQEVVQAKGLPTPEYTVVQESGPDHSKTFTVSAKIEKLPAIEGIGASKQKAEQAAALAALEKYFPDQNNVL
jgi:ribonuclease-3